MSQCTCNTLIGNCDLHPRQWPGSLDTQRGLIEVPNNVNQAQVLVTRMFESLSEDIGRINALLVESARRSKQYILSEDERLRGLAAKRAECQAADEADRVAAQAKEKAYTDEWRANVERAWKENAICIEGIGRIECQLSTFKDGTYERINLLATDNEKMQAQLTALRAEADKGREHHVLTIEEFRQELAKIVAQRRRKKKQERKRRRK